MGARLTLMILISSLLAACSAKIELEEIPSSTLPPSYEKVGSPAEFVSASTPPQKTDHGYTVMTSFGNYNRSLLTKTPNGYVVYQSVHGTVISGNDKAQH